jgi:Fic family protein
MIWNWQTAEWPNWAWNFEKLRDAEQTYLLQAGKLLGVWSHLSDNDRDTANIELLTDEAVRTSAIEGEILDRDSVQSSMRRQFGLSTDRRSRAAESGIAELFADCFRSWDAPLTAQMLFTWHQSLCRGRDDMQEIGRWRSQGDPMQVVSGPYQRIRVHFEAPPAEHMPEQMQIFIDWFNQTAANGLTPLPALTRAGLAHLYFVTIHPFEDGNGRIARALAEKALAQAINAPSLTSLAKQIERNRKGYYAELESNNKDMNVTRWLVWFANAVLEAQRLSEKMISHIVVKTQLFERLRGSINARQSQALIRMFDAGPEGFVGGLSAKNYMIITDATPATARRDLADLVKLGGLRRTGENKGTRYWLAHLPIP